VLGWLLLLANAASPETIPALDIEELVDQADLVVLGTFAQVRDLGFTEVYETGGGSGGRILAGRIIVSRMLKGYVTSDVIEFRSKVWAHAVADVAPALHGVVLLRRQRYALQFVSTHYPFIRGVIGAPIHGSDPHEAVAESVTAILRVPATYEAIRRFPVYGEPATPVIVNWWPSRRDPRGHLVHLAWEAMLANRFDRVLHEIAHALDDPRREVRFNAVRVLSEAMGRPISREDFRAREGGIKSEWRTRLAALQSASRQSLR
jgi:hypothetical protein